MTGLKDYSILVQTRGSREHYDVKVLKSKGTSPCNMDSHLHVSMTVDLFSQ